MGEPPGIISEAITVDELAETMAAYRFTFATERDLQNGIERVLESAKFPFEREFILSPKDRVDFLVVGGIALEVKTKGSLTALTMQVHRYLQDERVEGTVIVTSKQGHRNLPAEINGKPVRVVWLGGQSL
jgi:hypothetical protein